MARSWFDKRKDLGRHVYGYCSCGRVIHAHSTTIALAAISHIRAHVRRGEKVEINNKYDTPRPA